MRSFALLLVLVLAAFSVSILLPVRGEARTLIVPDDYSTIQKAINAAKEDDTIFVRSGTYKERILSIRKSISLIGEDAKSTNIYLDPPFVEETIFTQTFTVRSTSITIGANDVTISGFTISTKGGDISITGDKTQLIDNKIAVDEATQLKLTGCQSNITKNDFSAYVFMHACGDNNNICNNFLVSVECVGSYNNIAENSIAHSCGQIAINGSRNMVSGNTIRDSEVATIEIDGDANVITENNLTRSGGILIRQGSGNEIKANRVLHGGSLVLDVGYNNTFHANCVTNSNYGIAIGSPFTDAAGHPLAANNIIYHNNFINNTHQVDTDYVVYGINFWDDGNEDNYWSDYTGNDTNNDGIGDVPYIIDATRQDRYPLMLPFDIENNAMAFPTSEPASAILPVTPVAASVVSVGVIALGLLFYFKKRKHYVLVTFAF